VPRENFAGFEEGKKSERIADRIASPADATEFHSVSEVPANLNLKHGEPRAPAVGFRKTILMGSNLETLSPEC